MLLFGQKPKLLLHEVQVLTRLLAVAISAFRMSGSYLEDEDDLEFTAGETRTEEMV